MAEFLVQSESIETVADAIRAKTGVSGKLTFPEGFANAISGIALGSQVAMGTVSIARDGKSISLSPGFNPTKAILTLAGVTNINQSTGEASYGASAKIIFENGTATMTQSSSGTYGSTQTEKMTVSYSDGTWTLTGKNYNLPSGTYNWMAAS